MTKSIPYLPQISTCLRSQIQIKKEPTKKKGKGKGNLRGVSFLVLSFSLQFIQIFAETENKVLLLYLIFVYGRKGKSCHAKKL